MYESPAAYVTDQPAFTNAACKVATSLGPNELLERCKQVTSPRIPQSQCPRIPPSQWALELTAPGGKVVLRPLPIQSAPPPKVVFS